jgi:hypothetical protein
MRAVWLERQRLGKGVEQVVHVMIDAYGSQALNSRTSGH